MSMALRSAAAVRVSAPVALSPVAPQPAGRPVTALHRRCFLVIDPQALVRHGLALTLTSHHAGAQVVQAATVAEAGEALRRGAAADLVVMDVDGLGADKAGQVAAFVAAVAPTPVILMSGGPGGAEARAYLAAGVRAVLSKSDPSDVLEHAVALALSGEDYVLVPRPFLAPEAAEMEGGLDSAGLGTLTGRQREIFELLVEGCSNKEIARRLGVLEGTVKVHVRAMMQKLGARNRTQVAVLAARCARRPGQAA